MNDIAERVDRLKALANKSRECGSRVGPTVPEIVEIAEIGLDFIGELIGNSRRSATALRRIAEALESIDMHGGT